MQFNVNEIICVISIGLTIRVNQFHIYAKLQFYNLQIDYEFKTKMSSISENNTEEKDRGLYDRTNQFTIQKVALLHKINKYFFSIQR